MSGGLILAAPASASGKTTLTLALLRHFRNSGMTIASAKAGPDYIDPAFHSAASGTPCLNLDAWAMRRETIAALVASLERRATLVLCEGAMGLFDGAGHAGQGSTGDLAALTGWPVVLVVDVAGQAGSAAALLRGFMSHRPDVPVAGVIFNRVGGPRHASMLENSVRTALPALPILGHVPRVAELALPERHLGLVQAAEHPDLDGFLDRAAAQVSAAIDLERLLRLARSSSLAALPAAQPVPPLGQRVAVARDVAFAFAYPAMLEGWRSAGAELTLFSPLADEAPAADADAVFLPGGYPELHAGRLAGNRRFLAGLADAARRGAVIYGECGGYMVLGRGLVDAAGARHAMAGLLPLETSFAERRRELGYRQARLEAAGPLGKAGTAFRGHEYHYATILDEGGGTPLFATADADGGDLGTAGRVKGRVMGSFLHLVDRG
ncbi:MAG: cobyrinate a,c-diamide synthase [Stellaceae bacterium]